MLAAAAARVQQQQQPALCLRLAPSETVLGEHLRRQQIPFSVLFLKVYLELGGVALSSAGGCGGGGLCVCVSREVSAFWVIFFAFFAE